MRKKGTGFVVGTGCVLAAVLILLPFREHINSTPTALTFLLAVLFTAVTYGSTPAIFASLVSMICFNFFFIPPYHTLTVSDPQNWVALFAFLVTSLIAGGLSAKERQKAEEAEIRKKESERLYLELQNAFEKASQAEALKQSEQMKSALLDAVTHDLRTPLTSAKAAVTTLLSSNQEKDGLDEEGRLELLDVIDSELDHLNHLLEGVIEMAKIEAGAMEPRKAWSSMDEIVSICLNRASSITARHHVRVVMEPDLPPVRLDQKAIAEVLYVLIENAAKYSPPATEIVVRVGRTEQGELLLSVEDQGIGIPEELRQKVFEKFFRGSQDSALKPAPSGMGMGLAIARGIIEAHKGRIWIEGIPGGRGTRVSFTIPEIGVTTRMYDYSENPGR